MEVEAEEEVAALKGDDFVLFVYMKELDVVFEEVGFLEVEAWFGRSCRVDGI